jgi:hypothetical protein
MTERTFNAMQSLQTYLAQTTGSETNYLGVKKNTSRGLSSQSERAYRSCHPNAQTQKINNISKKFPGTIHNRPNKTSMSAAMNSTHKASDHQQGLHKTKKVDKKFRETTHLIEEFGLTLGPKLVDLELSHDEELLKSERATETTLRREMEDTRRKRVRKRMTTRSSLCTAEP